MSSVWNVVRATNFNSMPASENNGGNDANPSPDKFKRRLNVNSLRMSIRKRIPLKRINVNGTSPDYYSNNEAEVRRKQKVASAKKTTEAAAAKSSKVKCRGIIVEASVKKTFYKVTEQLTGNSTKRQLKDTPLKSTPRTRYRERLKSPPDTPGSPLNELESSLCSSTPLSQVKSLKRYMRRTSGNGNSTKRTPCKTAQSTNGDNCDDFSRHLELISCGIRHLEANGKKLTAAIGDVSTDFESSLQAKVESRGRLWNEEMKRYAPMGPVELKTTSQNNAYSQPSSLAKGMLRRTMTRMSLRVKMKPSLRSTKSASNIQSNCYNGPMSYGPRKLVTLRGLHK